MMLKERDNKNLTYYDVILAGEVRGSNFIHYDVILAGEVRGSCEYDIKRGMCLMRLNPPDHDVLNVYFGATGKSCEDALTNLITSVKLRVHQANAALVWLEDLIIKDKTLA